MNGEPTTYRINAPMTWREFKEMPDDLKALYINWLREKFNVPDIKIAEMFCVSGPTLHENLKGIGCQLGRRLPRGTTWDVDGFATWRNGATSNTAAQAEEAEAQGEKPARLDPLESATPTAAAGAPEETKAAVAGLLLPTAGCMQFVGPADQALQAIGNVLRGNSVRLYVSWTPIATEGAQDDRC